MEKHHPHSNSMEKHHPQTLLTTRKTFFYNFIPSKSEEDQCKQANKPYQVSKSLIEIRDVHTPPYFDPVNPWRIRRTLTLEEVTSGQIFIPCNEAFDHVFRYWSLELANLVVIAGKKLPLIIWDMCDESKPVSVSGQTIFFEKICDEGYNWGMLDLVKSRSIKANDEIGLYWDVRASAFIFEVLHRSSKGSQTAI